MRRIERNAPEVLKNIQALRAVAALLVVFDHMNGVLANSDPGSRTIFYAFRYIGNFGVDLFFVISGFIMVATNWNAFARPNASRIFLLRRVARIYPPYWFVLLPIVAAFVIAPHELMRSHEGRSDIVSSLFLLPQKNDPLLIVSWTLTFEMFFYVIFGLFLKVSRNALLPLLGLWFGVQMVLAIVLHGSANPYLGFLSIPLPLEFIMGAGVGYLFRHGTAPLARSFGAVGTIVIVYVWIASATPGMTAELGANGFARVIQFGIPAALIVYGAIGWEGRGGIIAPSWTVALGDASFAIYLWHVPIGIVIGAVAARLHVRGLFADYLIQVGCLIITLGVSLAAYRYFERPMTAFLNKQIARRFVEPQKISSLREPSGVLIENA